MNPPYHRPKQSFKKEIEILSSCQEGLLSTLLVSEGLEESLREPLFYVNTNLQLMIPNDNDSHIRMSYVAFLKICFQKKNKLSKVTLNKFKQQLCRDDMFLDLYPAQLINAKYSKYYNNIVFKKLLLEFLVLLENGDRNIIDYINQYPILDTIFLITFKTFLWHRKPNRQIEASILSVDSLITYFRDVLGIRLVNAGGQIIFEDFKMHIGFENWYLFLHDEDANPMAFAEESRVRPFQECIKSLMANNSGNSIGLGENGTKTPERSIGMERVLQNSWIIPEESIYERLQSQDYMFTEHTPSQQSRQKQQIKELIYSFKRSLAKGTESLNQSKQNRPTNNYGSFSQRVDRSRKKLLSQSANRTHNRSRQSKQNSFENVRDHSIVKLADSFEEVVIGHTVHHEKCISPNIRIINQ